MGKSVRSVDSTFFEDEQPVEVEESFFDTQDPIPTVAPSKKKGLGAEFGLPALDVLQTPGETLQNGTQNGFPYNSSSLLGKSVDKVASMPAQSKANPDGTYTLRTSDKIYNDNDDVELTTLSGKYKPVSVQSVNNLVNTVNQSLGITPLSNEEISLNPYATKLQEANAVENAIKNQIINKNAAANKSASVVGNIGLNNTSLTTDENAELKRVQSLKKKLSAELTIQGVDEAEAEISSDQSGNVLNKAAIYAGKMMGNPLADVPYSELTQKTIETLPSQFFTGLSYLKNSDPATFQRLTNSVQKNLPLSESQVAQVTADGIEIEQARLDRSMARQEISPDAFNTQSSDLQKKRYENLVNNKETLRAVLSNGIAEKADLVERGKNKLGLGGADATNAILGFRWNYDDNEIKSFGERTAIELGLDPTNPNVKEAIKYLQDNEGVMIMQNSIAKNGIGREFAKGLADPIRGIASSVESGVKSITGNENDVYIQGQSQGNVNVAEQRLKAEDTGWKGVVNDVVKGAGQFATQAGVALATSGLIGAVAEGLQAANLGASVGGELVGTAPAIGTAIEASKDFASTLITSFAQVYDNNLKQALNYTSDNTLAKGAAFINSTIEGLSENILSPIDIARKIGGGFRSKAATEGLLGILSEKNLLETPSKLTNFLKGTLKGIIETGKVAGTEIGEEFVTQIADFATNAYLNPNSDAFDNRDLANELAQTAYQTGLTMAIPALASGVGASNVNTFSKGSLMVAAQNRQQLLDDMADKLGSGSLSQEEHDRKATIINTAAAANESLPLKSDNTPLSSDQKADYVYSRTSEAVMKSRMDRSNDEAEKSVYAEKIKEQQDFRKKLLTDAGVAEVLPTNSNEAVVTPIPTVVADPTINDNQILSTFENVKSVIPEENLTTTESTFGKINNAETINVSELNNAEDVLYTALDKSPEAAHLIEPLILQIQNYPDEFKTKTEVSTVTENQPIEGSFANKSKQEIRPALEQSIGGEASITRPSGLTQVGTLKVVDGNYVIQSEGNNDEVIGERQITNRDLKLPSEEKVPEPIEFDENQNVSAVTFETPNGDLIKITNPDTALDLAIQLQANAIGNIPDAAFEQAYQKVSKTVAKEVPVRDANNENKTTQVSDTKTQTSASNKSTNKTVQSTETLTPKEQKAVDTIKAKEFTGSVTGWTNVLKDDNSTVSDKKQALKELKEQLLDTNSETQMGTALGRVVSDAIYDLENDTSGTTTSTGTNTAATPNGQSKPKAKGQGENKGQVPGSSATTGSNNAGATTPVLEKTYAEKAKIVADKIRQADLPRWLANPDSNNKVSGLSGNILKNALADAVEQVGRLLDTGVELSKAITTAFDDFKKVFTDNNEAFDEANLRAGFEGEMNNQFAVEDTPEVLAEKVKKNEINYDEAIEGKSADFISKLDKVLFGSSKFTLNEDVFRQRVLDQKNYGISESDIIANYEAAKKLTKRQKEIISEVFGGSAENDKAAAELQEAFKKLAMGKKPKKVLQRLGISDVTHLVKALSDFLNYKAVSNVQLEALADYIVDSIELDKSDKYINAMVNNSMADVKQVLRAKLIVALQNSGNEALATQFVNDMADDAVSSGRQTQSLRKAYEILGAKGSPKMRTAFAVKYAESVQKKALEMNKKLASVVSTQEAEITRLNERIHNDIQKRPSTIEKIKEVISNLCGLRNKK